MLVAPYVSGNSFLTAVAFGIVPIFQSDRIFGSILFLSVYVPYFVSQDILYSYQSYYWTFLLVAVWLYSAMKVNVFRKRPLTPLES
jgi:hypothetical protein